MVMRVAAAAVDDAHGAPPVTATGRCDDGVGWRQLKLAPRVCGPETVSLDTAVLHKQDAILAC